jgi:hypothetical protein
MYLQTSQVPVNERQQVSGGIVRRPTLLLSFLALALISVLVPQAAFPQQLPCRRTRRHK